MPVTVVPDQDPGQNILLHILDVSPYSPSWWSAQVITQIPAESVGWLVAQGWQITAITYDSTTVPPTPYFTMGRESLQNMNILQSLLDVYTSDRNKALTNNAIRYNDVVTNWELLIDTTHDQFDAQVDEQNDHETIFLGILDGYMADIDTLIAESQAQIDEFEPDYTLHANDSPVFLEDLGATDLARINEEFAATLAVQLQQLSDQGLYSSPLRADITARNTRDRDEQIQLLNDRLNREKLDNDHRLYEQKATMRDRTLAGTTQLVTEKLNQNSARLSAQQAKHDEIMRLMAYQLDERNKLYVGLYSFVERRDDVPPTFEALTQIATSLGDSGGGWVTP